ncbi:MAG: glycosyltransferase family 1 protein, partial [Planctomycetota bacterium]|nr:glycosyltransferase family 1 protein [Planctomycetota bacterium]
GRRRRRSPFVRALREHIGPLLARYPEIQERLERSRWLGDGPAMSEHDAMAAFTDDLTDLLAMAMAPDAVRALRRFDRAGLVDALVGYASIAAMQAPHIFSLFHQNKERRFLRELQSHRTESNGASRGGDGLKVMLFTDTLGDINGVCRFIQNMGEQVAETGRELHIVTSTRFPVPDRPYIHNFDPVFATRMPKYENLELALPPMLRMLRLADRVQPDVIHISTPGPVGMVGQIASKMLHTPRLGVYHTDFPAYIDHLFEDAVYTRIASDFMQFFYRSFHTVFSRSDDYIEALASHGFPRERAMRLRPGVALETFQPSYRDESYWNGIEGVSAESVKVLYCGRVSVEKNLPLLTKVWPRVRGACRGAGVEAELIVVGDGPYRKRMERELSGKGAHFLGFRHGEELSTVYASCDLFAFPSMTDTLGQVVLESQSSGLPVIVTDQGGPKEVVAEGITGFILPGKSESAWTETITRLATDEELRERMGRSAHTRAQRYSIRGSFEHFWEAHEQAHRTGGRESQRNGAAAAGRARSAPAA